jgi:CelD/BcsL family acetyltransferase involved in cellulose biosynthesis
MDHKLDLKTMSMRIVRFTDLAELKPYADAWDELAHGVPFRTWTWMSCWWRHYATARPSALYVLGVFDRADRLVGVAPWYMSRSSTWGRVIQWLGSGEVCSDYLDVLCRPADVDVVAESLAQWLADRRCAGARGPDAWDLARWTAVDAQSPVAPRIAGHLERLGCLVNLRDGPRCWRLELPTQWEAYHALLSKSHRKQVRRLERNVLDTGRVRLHSTESMAQWSAAMSVLVDLHGRRRNELGQRGCFVAPRFAAFHHEVSAALLRRGQCELHWLELDGRPVAAEYHLLGNGVAYAYQAGVLPEALDCEPGKLITIALLRRAVERGYREFDFLRGDEPYKAHFRAQARPTREFRVAPPNRAARWRLQLWAAGSRVRQWMRGSVGSES